MKEESQLSYQRLAEQTHYSRSSWQRFLNGKRLPTPGAVKQLANLTGAELEPLLAMLEQESASAEAEAAPEPAPLPVSAPVPVRVSAPIPVPIPLTAATPLPAPAPEPAAEESTAVARRALPDASAAHDTGHGSPGEPSRRRRARLRVLAAVGYIFVGAVIGAIMAGLTGLMAGAVGLVAASRLGTGGAPWQAVASSAGTDVKVGCTSGRCIERDPQEMDCLWDAATVRETWLRGVHIEVRYSSACQAVWGRIENGAVGDTVVIKDSTSLQAQATIRSGRGTYTPMLAVTPSVPVTAVNVCGLLPGQKLVGCSSKQRPLP